MPLTRLAGSAAIAWAAARPAIALLEETCPGSVDVPGYGKVEIVATQWNLEGEESAKVDVVDGKIMPNLKGRSYFADACQPGQYNNSEYVALPLLGKQLKFTIDLSGAGCGCNAAFYMTSMHQNSQISTCQDYYCDANNVCGVDCAEIDIMEANTRSFQSTMHGAGDSFGIGGGYGGGGPEWSGPRDWSMKEYGPEGRCINTSSPFQVTSAFPVDSDGSLEAMVVTLSQAGMPCELSLKVDKYDGNTTIWRKGSHHGMLEMSEALRKGMTPIISFWESDDMSWLDSKGQDGKGACSKDLVVPCPAQVPMYDFSVESIPVEEEDHARFALYLLLGFAFIPAVIFGLYQLAKANTFQPLLEESDSEMDESS